MGVICYPCPQTWRRGIGKGDTSLLPFLGGESSLTCAPDRYHSPGDGTCALRMGLLSPRHVGCRGPAQNWVPSRAEQGRGGAVSHQHSPLFPAEKSQLPLGRRWRPLKASGQGCRSMSRAPFPSQLRAGCCQQAACFTLAVAQPGSPVTSIRQVRKLRPGC